MERVHPFLHFSPLLGGMKGRATDEWFLEAAQNQLGRARSTRSAARREALDLVQNTAEGHAWEAWRVLPFAPK